MGGGDHIAAEGEGVKKTKLKTLLKAGYLPRKSKNHQKSGLPPRKINGGLKVGSKIVRVSKHCEKSEKWAKCGRIGREK